MRRLVRAAADDEDVDGQQADEQGDGGHPDPGGNVHAGRSSGWQHTARSGGLFRPAGCRRRDRQRRAAARGRLSRDDDTAAKEYSPPRAQCCPPSGALSHRRRDRRSGDAELVALGVAQHHPVLAHLVVSTQRGWRPGPDEPLDLGRDPGRALRWRRARHRPAGRCATRFLTVFGSGTFCKNSRGPAPSGSTHGGPVVPVLLGDAPLAQERLPGVVPRSGGGWTT